MPTGPATPPATSLATPPGAPGEERAGDGEPEWLSEHERDTWLGVWSIVLQLPSVLEAQLQHDADLGLFDYMVMARLSMIPDRQRRMGELAAMTGGSMSRLSNVVKRLEGRGLVQRHPDPANGRYIIATLTDAGYDVVESAAPGHVRAVRRYVFDPLTDEQVRLLHDIGGRIADRIRQDSGVDADRAVATDCSDLGAPE